VGKEDAIIAGRGTRLLPITRHEAGHIVIRRELPTPRSNLIKSPFKTTANSTNQFDDFEDSECEENWC